MRFVAGRGAVAELLAGSAMAGLLARSAMAKRMAALWQRAIGKILLAGSAVEDRGKRVRQQAPARQAICRKGCTIGKTLPAGTLQRRAIGKQARKEPQLQAGKEYPALQANKKESGKAHSLKPALVMTALVRVTGARPRGSSQLLLCSLELLW